MSTDHPDDPLIGRRFGGDGSVVLAKLIGRGGSGSVYMAWDESHQRVVAVKVLARDYASNPTVLQRFLREGERFGTLDHPNLVRVFGSGRDQGRLYIISEFVAGRNLYQLLKREGPFPLRRALEVGRDAAAGLAFAHRHDIVHRDLKPENIMVRRTDGVVKVLDFGIAKDLKALEDITQLGTYIGTPAYSAPEQVRGEKVDHRADIFSLGVILYEILTGKVAFDGRHSTEVLKATLRERPIPVGELNHRVTAPVARLVERMMEKVPAHRHRQMDEVIAEIDGLLARLPAEWVPEEEAGVREVLRGIFQS